MPNLETAELSFQERGILATTASASDSGYFSQAGRSLVSEPSLTRNERRYNSGGQEYVVEWLDYGQPLPAWFDSLMQGFVNLFTLPPNWDSYGARPIDPDLIHKAMNFMNGLLGASSPAPRVVPLSSGGLQLEWHRKGIDLEIMFERGEQPFFYSRNRVNGDEAEQTLPDNSPSLRAIIDQLE